MKLSPANVVAYIHREIAELSWDWEVVMKAGQALGFVKSQTRYENSDFSYVLRKLCYKALKSFGLSKAERKPRGPLAWSRKLCEMWSVGELNNDKVVQIIHDYAREVASKVKSSEPESTPPKPKPPQKRSWVSSGVMGTEFKIEHSTAVALCKAIEHMNNWTGGFLSGEFFNGDRINRKVNEMIRAAAEAVTGFVPKSSLRFRAPYAFTAREETHAEREMRLMLEAISE